MELFNNPFRPSAGQYPPYLAGREHEKNEFIKLLQQKPILKNLVLTGLRGVGKTVLLETFKPITYEQGWFWVGTDLNEAASISEHALSVRILADLSKLVFSLMVANTKTKEPLTKTMKDTFNDLYNIYVATPGLEADKLKSVLESVWEQVKFQVKGVVLAYDEAQILKDKAVDKEYPLSLLLEVVQYLQKKEIPYFLLLTGLPTLYPNLIEARTYAERMFQIITLDKLSDTESREAILNPINKQGKKKCPVTFSEHGINEIIKYSNGYPYFIQFICKETFDNVLQQIKVGIEEPNVEFSEIIKKLDIDFYSGRWSRVTDRQRDLLVVIAKLPSANEEFTIKEVVMLSQKTSDHHFKTAQVNNLFVKLIDMGLVFKNRRSKYSFAVPLLADYINRQNEDQQGLGF
jgi:hypothetical protein